MPVSLIFQNASCSAVTMRVDKCVQLFGIHNTHVVTTYHALFSLEYRFNLLQVSLSLYLKTTMFFIKPVQSVHWSIINKNNLQVLSRTLVWEYVSIKQEAKEDWTVVFPSHSSTI